MAYLMTGRERPGPSGSGLRAAVGYGGDSESIARSRAFTAAFLDRAADEHALYLTARARAEAQLVVSELMTNACKYAPGPVALTLHVCGRFLEIALRDGDPVPPVVTAAAGAAVTTRVGGHGLEIVLAVCETFEVRRVGAGKCVTVSLPLDRV